MTLVTLSFNVFAMPYFSVPGRDVTVVVFIVFSSPSFLYVVKMLLQSLILRANFHPRQRGCFIRSEDSASE